MRAWEVMVSFSGPQAIDDDVDPWPNESAVPPTLHDISIDRRIEQPDARVLCSCGFDSGWQSLAASDRDAELHRRDAGSAPDRVRPPESSL
jgi:hypothetical protein